MRIITHFVRNITAKTGTPASIFFLNVNFLFLLMCPDFCFPFFQMSIFSGNFLNEALFRFVRKEFNALFGDVPRTIFFFLLRFYKYSAPLVLLTLRNIVFGRILLPDFRLLTPDFRLLFWVLLLIPEN